MSDPVELLDDCPVDLRPVVAVDVAPEARMAVDVPVAVRVEHVLAPAGGDNQRVGLVPQRVLRERVPEESAVPVGELTPLVVGDAVIFAVGGHDAAIV